MNQTMDDFEHNTEKYILPLPAEQNVYISKAHRSTHAFRFLLNVLNPFDATFYLNEQHKSLHKFR